MTEILAPIALALSLIVLVLVVIWALIFKPPKRPTDTRDIGAIMDELNKNNKVD